jgi:nanoRNase/pAp phosphatase (c-di-AMP/oligoRNAs hydrolase)
MIPPKWDLSKSENKLARLSTLLAGIGRSRMLVLCHNNPDPDSIAGAFALSYLFSKKFGVRSVIGYGGAITRAENKAMIQRLRIRMTRMSRVDSSKFYGVALMDGQPGTGNNLLDTRFEPPLIVIDHHPLRKMSLRSKFADIRVDYGATSTIVTEYLVAAGLTPSRSVANALLYGLKTDTNSLARGASKADFCAFNYLSSLSNPRVLACIERPPLSQEYFEDYLRGLSQTTICRDVAISNLGRTRSDSIIPELADFLLRIEGVTSTLSMGEHKNVLLLSLRTTSRKYKAGNLIRRLVGESGSGGGHREMAGGMIPLSGMSKSQKQEVTDKLVAKFLKLIDRQTVTPKHITESLGNKSC